MSTTAKHDCDKPVVQLACDHRHRGITRWMSAQIALMVIILGSASTAYVVARCALQDVAVQKASQQAVNARVLESLKRIETDVRILRNGRGRE